MDTSVGTKRKIENDSDTAADTDSVGKQPKYIGENSKSDSFESEQSEHSNHLDQTQEYELVDYEGYELKSNSQTTCSPGNAMTSTRSDIGKIKSDKNGDDCVVDSEIKCNGVHESETNSSDGRPTMLKIQSVQRDAELISSIIPEVDEKLLYEKILKHRAEKNRVDLVTNVILENGMSSESNLGSTTNVSQADSAGSGIFKDVADVLIKCPAADANMVYEMLEKLEGEPDRIIQVLDQLNKQGISCRSSSASLNSSSVAEKDSRDPFNDPAFKSNPLYRDLKTLRKVLPEKDPAELYAYLEAHFEKGNRVQIVIDELTKSDSQESSPLDMPDSLEHFDKGKQPAVLVNKLQIDLQELEDIIPDCDPDFLFEKLEDYKTDPERVGKIASALLESKNYPKLKERLEKEKKLERKRQIGNLELNMKDFLKKFPNPFQFFDDIERQVNRNYQTHTLVYLKNTYPFLKDGYIRKLLIDSKQHLSPAVKQIEQENFDTLGRTSKKMRATPRQELIDYPDEPEELFFQEVIFCNNRQKIKDYLDEKRRERELKVSVAKERGELLECGCCYDDECLFEEMGACADGHIFCKECISRSSEAAIGEGKSKFMCLTGTCEQQFPLQTLQEVLPAKTFALALRKLQEEELRLADIPNLVACPFCSFATVMPNEDDKVFKCLNPECLRESCRLCKEPNHVPLRCSEVEKQGETNMRTYIETKMSEAMLRTCPRCKKRFYKESGCNKMTCTCGMTMCYVCREAGIDYGHFDQEKCKIESDIFTLHKDEMLRAAEEARQEYLRDHPDQDRELKYDPLKLLKNLQNMIENGYGDSDAEDDYDE